MIRILILAIITSCTLLIPVQCAPKKSGNKDTTIEIKDTSRFFEWFFDTKNKCDTNRGEFETEGEYKKRIPPALNSNKVVYFKLACTPGKKYSYDLPSNMLTIYGGASYQSYEVNDGSENAKKGMPIVIKSVNENYGSYNAQNAFGATTRVESSAQKKYILNIINQNECPSGLIDGGRFTACVTAERALAKQLSKTVEMIVGVRLPGYSFSRYDGSRRSPTYDLPYEITTLDYMIDAYFVKLIVRDKSTGKVYAIEECDVN